MGITPQAGSALICTILVVCVIGCDSNAVDNHKSRTLWGESGVHTAFHAGQNAYSTLARHPHIGIVVHYVDETFLTEAAERTAAERSLSQCRDDLKSASKTGRLRRFSEDGTTVAFQPKHIVICITTIVRNNTGSVLPATSGHTDTSGSGVAYLLSADAAFSDTPVSAVVDSAFRVDAAEHYDSIDAWVTDVMTKYTQNGLNKKKA